jgi:hypothetical protein
MRKHLHADIKTYAVCQKTGKIKRIRKKEKKRKQF